MRVNVVGYNKVDYQKDGDNRSFYKFFVCEKSHSDRISFGVRCAEVLASTNYAENKILPAIANDASLAVGWDKDRKSFLYIAE